MVSNRNLLFQGCIFRCYVSFNEGITIFRRPQKKMMQTIVYMFLPFCWFFKKKETMESMVEMFCSMTPSRYFDCFHLWTKSLVLFSFTPTAIASQSSSDFTPFKTGFWGPPCRILKNQKGGKGACLGMPGKLRPSMLATFPLASWRA